MIKTLIGNFANRVNFRDLCCLTANAKVAAVNYYGAGFVIRKVGSDFKMSVKNRVVDR